MVTISSIKKKNVLSSVGWNVICFISALSIFTLICCANNVLLKLRNNVWVPKLTDKGKGTFKSNPETYVLSKTQRDPYRKI